MYGHCRLHPRVYPDAGQAMPVSGTEQDPPRLSGPDQTQPFHHLKFPARNAAYSAVEVILQNRLLTRTSAAP
jgi:hypothetical protein